MDAGGFFSWVGATAEFVGIIGDVAVAADEFRENPFKGVKKLIGAVDGVISLGTRFIRSGQGTRVYQVLHRGGSRVVGTLYALFRWAVQGSKANQSMTPYQEPGIRKDTDVLESPSAAGEFY